MKKWQEHGQEGAEEDEREEYYIITSWPGGFSTYNIQHSLGSVSPTPRENVKATFTILTVEELRDLFMVLHCRF